MKQWSENNICLVQKYLQVNIFYKKYFIPLDYIVKKVHIVRVREVFLLFGLTIYGFFMIHESHPKARVNKLCNNEGAIVLKGV